jgi:hypothetical protein
LCTKRFICGISAARADNMGHTFVRAFQLFGRRWSQFRGYGCDELAHHFCPSTNCRLDTVPRGAHIRSGSSKAAEGPRNETRHCGNKKNHD